ncbi:ABC transporter permease [Thermobacillus sp. ZCTH02-B1]|uniref:ABC transporter permease n=1 Tax=Thermobacillus sp. ZCTH02-B1 TaxID=1858795 RepID=UPI0025F1F640|nr:ABC transporter permease [Thermobacillus sp. ZCTH02-B1]
MALDVKSLLGRIARRRDADGAAGSEQARDAAISPFWIIVQKEFSDHIRSWRFTILLALIFLACIGSIFSAVSAIRGGKLNDDLNFLFLQIFTISDGTWPNFITFVTFLGPLMGIALGFDAVNSERNRGTLSRLMSQPIYRDDFILAKFTASLLLVTVVIFALGLLVAGLGLFAIGYPPTPEEFWRIFFFLVLAVFYVGFWLNLSILFSIRFRQAATSALSSLALWIFFTVFYGLVLNLISNAIAPSSDAGVQRIINYQQTMLWLNRLSPAELFSEATTTLLTPNVRTLGPFTLEQIYLAIASPLPLGQSLLLVWPHFTGLIAATVICFGISYVMFMRQEIRSRS